MLGVDVHERRQDYVECRLEVPANASGTSVLARAQPNPYLTRSVGNDNDADRVNESEDDDDDDDGDIHILVDDDLHVCGNNGDDDGRHICGDHYNDKHDDIENKEVSSEDAADDDNDCTHLRVSLERRLPLPPHSTLPRRPCLLPPPS